MFTNSTDPAHWADQSFTLVRFTTYNLSPGNVPPASGWIKSLAQSTQEDNTKWHSKASLKTSTSSSCGKNKNNPPFLLSSDSLDRTCPPLHVLPTNHPRCDGAVGEGWFAVGIHSQCDLRPHLHRRDDSQQPFSVPGSSIDAFTSLLSL